MITINTRGARTLADAQPLIHDGHKVYVTVGTEFASLHIGGRIVAERPAAEVASIIAAQDWAYEVIEAPAATGITEADYNQAVHGPSVQKIRAAAAEKLALAAEKDAKADAEAARPSRAPLKSARHPQHRANRIRQAAEGLRKDAVILAAWTIEDEAAYNLYVCEARALSDFYCTPIDRAAWKRTLGA